MQADSASQSNTFGSCQAYGDPCFSGTVNSIFSCTSSDKITPLFPTCPLCTAVGYVWVTANFGNSTLSRPDVGQCFTGIYTDMPMTCPDCTNTDRWKHISRTSDCSAGQVSLAPTIFENPSINCAEVCSLSFEDMHPVF